jgi:hypothetical protein
MFLFCVSSFTVQCVPFTGFGWAAASCRQGGSFGDGRVIFLFSSDSYLSRCCFCDVQLWLLWGLGGLADVIVLRVSFVGCLGRGYGWQVLHLQWKWASHSAADHAKTQPCLFLAPVCCWVNE